MKDSKRAVEPVAPPFVTDVHQNRDRRDVIIVIIIIGRNLRHKNAGKYDDDDDDDGDDDDDDDDNDNYDDKDEHITMITSVTGQIIDLRKGEI